MQLLKLRYLQLKRDLGYWVPVFSTGAFFIAREISGVFQMYSLILAACCLFFLYIYHSGRKDLDFLKTYFTRPKRDLLINYNLLMLPVSAGIISTGDWLSALLLHLGVTLISLSRINASFPRLSFIGSYIPAEQFEWTSGLRKNFYVLVPLVLVAAFLSPVKFFGPVALFLLNSIFLGFYNYFEPLLMLNPEHLQTEVFLRRKVLFFCKVILLLNTPLLLLNSLFHADVAWFNASFLAGFLLLASCTIYIKYAHYKPNDDMRFHLDFLFLALGTLIPFLIPVSLFLNHSHKQKALQNLSYYIDDNS